MTRPFESPVPWRRQRWLWGTTALAGLILVGQVGSLVQITPPLRAGHVWGGLMLFLYAGLVAARIRAAGWWQGTVDDRAWAWMIGAAYWVSTIVIGGHLLVMQLYATGVWRVP